MIYLRKQIKNTKEEKNGMVESGKFRQKKTNFSIVSNSLIHDPKISLKGKGLYCIIQSFVTIPNFVLYKSHLKKSCKEGSKAFETAWKELKDKGYLVQYRVRDERGQFVYEYELLDTAKEPHPQNGDMDIFLSSHTPKNGDMDFPVRDLPYKDNWGDINKTNINNTNLNNTHITHADVMQQIGYTASQHDDFVENLILLMVDILNTPDDSLIRVNQASQKAKVVKERFRQIRYKHIEYVKLVFSEYTGEISSIRNYIITALFNSVTTCDIYFAQRVQHDLYGEWEQQWKAAK